MHIQTFFKKNGFKNALKSQASKSCMCSIATFSWTIWWHYVPSLPNIRMRLSTKKDIPAKDSLPINVNVDTLPLWPSNLGCCLSDVPYVRRVQFRIAHCVPCNVSLVSFRKIWKSSSVSPWISWPWRIWGWQASSFVAYPLPCLMFPAVRSRFCIFGAKIAEVVLMSSWCMSEDTNCDLPHRRGCLVWSLD